MQQSQFFENQIIKPSNLDFMNNSTAKNVKDVITAFTKGQAGAVYGLEITGSGSASATITAGYGFLANGERVQLFVPSGLTFTLPQSGTTEIYASLVQVNYNPNPSENPLGSSNVVSGLNAASLEFQPVEQYNLANITTSSGDGTYIRLGDIITNFGLIEEIDYTNRQNLKVGEIDLFSNTIDGQIISLGSIDSNQFTSELHYDVNINSGATINFLGSGTQSIGSIANPLASVIATSGVFHDISGFSPITVDSLAQKVGTSLESNDTHVSIDTANKGTKFGDGLVIDKNSIDLNENAAGPDANLTIATQPSAKISLVTGSIDANLNLGSLNINNGGMTINNGDLTISNGTINVPTFRVNTLIANYGISGNTNVFGGLNITGDLAFSGTAQHFENLLSNGLMYPSGSIASSGTINLPGIWTGSNPEPKYVVGPIGPAQTSAYPNFATPLPLWTYLQGRNEYTFEFVFKPSTVSNLGRLFLFNTAGGYANNLGWWTGNPSTVSSLVFRGNDHSIICSTPAGVLTPNTWVHAAVTSSGSAAGNVNIYINGELKGTSATPNTKNTFPASILGGRIGPLETDTPTDLMFLKGVKISNKAKTVFPSGLCDLVADSDTVALYDFNIVPSGVNKISSPSLGNLVTLLNPLGYHEAPSGTYTISSNFMGQSFSGSTVLDYRSDTKQPGTINVFSGESNSPYYFQISGNNITSNGFTFSTPANLDNSKTYHVSYFTKLISGSSVNFLGNGSNEIGVKAYISGNNYISPFFSGAKATSEWTRNDFDFTAPSTGGDFNLCLNTYSASGNTISGVSLIGLSSAQITQGPAKLEVLHNSPKVYNFSPALPDTYYPSWPNRWSVAPVGTGVWQTSIISGTVYSNGGYALLNANINYDVYFNSTSNTTNDVYVSTMLVVDGKNINSSLFYWNVDIATQGGPEYPSPQSVSHAMYLAKGLHSVQLVASGAFNTPVGGVITLFAFNNPYETRPKLNVVML